MDLKKLDLNLLISLSRLLELKNVSVASESLGISQPALSHQLAKLRKWFDDPLLVRVGQKYELTLKAQRLSPKIEDLIKDLKFLLKSEEFDPDKKNHEFTIAASDYTSYVLIPKILLYLEKNYPKIKLKVIPLVQDLWVDNLRDLRVDLALGTGYRSDIPEDLYAKNIFQEKFACAYVPSKKLKNIEMNLA